MIKLIKNDKKEKCGCCNKNSADYRVITKYSNVAICQNCAIKRCVEIIRINKDIIALHKTVMKEYNHSAYQIKKLNKENKNVIEQLGVLYD